MGAHRRHCTLIIKVKRATVVSCLTYLLGCVHDSIILVLLWLMMLSLCLYVRGRIPISLFLIPLFFSFFSFFCSDNNIDGFSFFFFFFFIFIFIFIIEKCYVYNIFTILNFHNKIIGGKLLLVLI